MTDAARPAPTTTDPASEVRRSVCWDVPLPLSPALRAQLHQALDVGFTDENRSRGGWGRLAPDCQLVASPRENAFRLVLHWADSPEGLRSDPGWARQRVRQQLQDLLGLDPGAPSPVAAGLGALTAD